MTYYTGIDVSLRSVSICVIDDKGEVRLEAKVAADVDAIVDRLRRFSADVTTVGFEAGTLTQYLTYGLQAAGFEVICLEARQVSLSLAAMRNGRCWRSLTALRRVTAALRPSDSSLSLSR